MDLPCPIGRRAPLIEALEPRLLFSGDAAGAAVGEAIAWAAPASAAESAVAWTAPVAADASMQAAAPRELAVVDARVPDVGRLLQSLDAQRAAGRPIDVLVLGAGEDALQVLDAELAASDVPYRAVHFFGHGTAGSMQLGATSLDLATVRANAGSIAGWSDGLSADADLLLWGCDTGAGAAGAVLLDALADLTGADVAASDDATGGLSYGADWTLEVVRGPIEAQAPIEAALQASFAGVLAAEAPAGPDEVVVPADSGGRQLAGNATGSVAVWVDADDGEVFAQRYDAAGAKTGGTITVSAAEGRAASVAMDADGGGFIVVWQDGTGATGQILAQRFSDAGVAVGSALSITADATDNPHQPAVAMNASGDAVVVWAQDVEDDDTTTVDLVYRRISAAGLLGADTHALLDEDDRMGDQTLPSVAMQSDGGFAVAFRDSAGGGSIKVVAVPDATDPADGRPAVRVSAIGETSAAAPSIAAMSGNQYALAWSASAASPAVATVRAVVVDSETGAAGTSVQVSDAASGVAAVRPSVAVAPDGTIAVVWQQDDSGTIDVRGRVLTATGAAYGASFRVNQETAGAQRIASAAVVNGALQVGWTGPSTGGSPIEQTWVRTMDVLTQDDSGGRRLAANGVAGFGSVGVWVDVATNTVVAQRYTDAGATNGALITVSVGAGRTPAVAMDADGGGFIVVWQDGTDESGVIYAQRYRASGAPDGGPIAITADASDLPSRPAVAMNANGDAVVVWAQEMGNGPNRSVDLVYSRILASDTVASSPVTLTHNSERSGIQTNPAVAMQADGGFAVAFLDVSSSAIRVIAVPDSGDPANGIKSELLSQVGHAVGTAPSIAALASGHYAAAWSSAAAESVATVQAAVVDSETGVPGTAFQVSDAAAGVSASRPSIAVAPGDTLVVIWQQDNAGEVDVRGRLVSTTGTLYQPSYAINPLTAGAQHHASVAVLDGVVHVLWSGPSDSPTPTPQTWFRAIANPIAVTWPTSAVTSEADGTTGGATVQVVLTMPPAGTVTVVVTVINSRTGANEASVIGGVLTFTALNWYQPQTVTIRGNNELHALDDGDQDYVVRVAVDPSLTLASWQGITPQDRTFTNQDNDAYSEFVVNTNADVDDVNPSARASGDPLTPFDLWLHAQNGHAVSLREALLAANYADEAGDARDTIRFALGAGTQRITLSTALPAIVHAVDIDGGAPATPGGPLNVELTPGNGVGGDGLALAPGSDGSRIARLSIGGFSGNAVLVRSSDNTIEGNHLGVDASGTGAFGNGQRGLSLHDDNDAVAVAGNLVRDNVIGSNEEGGIRILGGRASGNVVQGNFIGTDRSLTRSLGNGFSPGVDPFGYGILLTNGAHDNLIGGTVQSQQNVLRHNGNFGIVVATDTSRDNALIANVIDADATPIERRTEERTVPTPVLTNARPGSNASTTRVDVSLTGTAGAYYRLDFYVDRTAFEPGSTQPVDAQTWISGVSTRVVRLGLNGQWSGTVTLTVAPQYTMAVVATATRTDNATPTPTFYETSALSTASRVNQVPIFEATSNLSVDENIDASVTSGPWAVSVLRANDPDVANGPLTWTIIGGDDRARFTIDSATGALSLNFPPDFENPQDRNASDPNNNNSYQVEVQARDALGGQTKRTYIVRVNNLNDRPTVALPPAAVPATEDTDLVLQNATGLSVNDPDRVSDKRQVVVELSVDRGTLELDNDLEDVTYRDGTSRFGSRIVIGGDLEDIQDALERIGYRPAADHFGIATLTITVRDRDNAALVSSGSVQIAIAAVNDAPVVAVTPPDEAINLRATGTLALDPSLLGTTDVDDTPERIVYTMRSGPLAGQLLRDGVQIGVGGSFTQADVNAGRMRFMAPTQGGPQQLSLAVTDGSNASATYGPIVLKLSVHSHAVASMSSQSSSSTSAGGAGAGQGADGSAAAADGGASGADGGGASARAGGSGAAAAAAAAARAGDASAGGGAASGATTSAAPTSGAIAMHSGGAEQQAARTDTSGSARDTADAAMNVNASASALGATLAHAHAETERIRNATGGMTAGALADAWRRAGAQQTAEQAAEIQQVWSPVVALRQADFREELAQSREEATSKFQASTALVASSVAISTSLSLGYAIWLLRGGVLLTSLLASMPAWSSIDPLPVLARIDARGQDDDDEDDSLRGMLQRAADEQAERVAEADALADRAAVPAGRLAEGIA
jgi:hypothetical protein